MKLSSALLIRAHWHGPSPEVQSHHGLCRFHAPYEVLPFLSRNLNDDIIPQVGALQVTANIVFGYAT